MKYRDLSNIKWHIIVGPTYIDNTNKHVVRKIIKKLLKLNK